MDKGRKLTFNCTKCRKYMTIEEFKYCGSCKLISYCSKACQTADWKRHKPLCIKRCKDSSHLSTLIYGFLELLDSDFLLRSSKRFYRSIGVGSLYTILDTAHMEDYINGTCKINVSESAKDKECGELLRDPNISCSYIPLQFPEEILFNYKSQFYLSLIIILENVSISSILKTRDSPSNITISYKFINNKDGTTDILFRSYRPNLEYDVD